MSRHTSAMRAVLVTVGCTLPTACAVFDAFAPTGAADNVAWAYVGPTCMGVGDSAAFSFTLFVNGVVFTQQRLRFAHSDPTVVTTTPDADTLVALKIGNDTLQVRLVHSTIGVDAPDTSVVIRVQGSCPP